MASPELQQILEMMAAAPRPENPTLEEQRARMEAFARAVDADVAVEEVVAGGVPAEWISISGQQPATTVLYLHGGGYVIGSRNSHRELVSRVARASIARALSLEYRLAPEHRCPAAVDDAVAAYQWLLDQDIAPASIVVAGDSAGGGLTVATLIAIRDRGLPLPAAGVCISPWVDLTGSGDSMTSNAAVDPMVGRELLGRMAAHYAGEDLTAPLASPLFADLSGLPPLLLQVGTAETLLDDSTRLAERATAAGVDVTLEPWEDMIHVWHFFAGMLPEGQQAIDRIGAIVRERAGLPAATPA